MALAPKLVRSIFGASRLFQGAVRPEIYKTQIACAWIGSYRIRNPQDYLDQFPKPRRWPRYNELIEPPQLDPTEERRPASYYHYRDNVKTSPKKMWYVMKFIRGMSVDEAIKQLSFIAGKPSQIAIEVLREAQAEAIKNHNFEYTSKMWIEDAKAVKGLVIKGLRKHARMRFGQISYFYSHILVKLREGNPPQHFYRPPKDGNDMLKDYYDELRARKIPQGL